MKNNIDLRVNLGLVLRGPTEELRRILQWLETNEEVTVIYKRTSGYHLVLTEEKTDFGRYYMGGNKSE